MTKQWRRLSLAAQFAIAGSMVLMAIMGAIGTWVTKRIESGVAHNTAGATALYMDSVLAPLLQELAENSDLSASAQLKIDKLLSDTQIGRRIQSFKVWKEGGLVVYSSRPALIGQRFPPTENLINAWAGQVSADLDDLHDEEDALERGSGIPLLEIYAPIRKDGSDRVIAVAEFYAKAEQLTKDIASARRQSWLVVGLSTLGMLLALSGIVLRGSRTIESQRHSLHGQVEQLTKLLEQNQALRKRVETAYRRTAALNERFLRRVGADLHDGPAQLLGLSLLKIDALKEGTHPPPCGTIEPIRSVLREALSDIRRISSGLALPELKNAGLAEALDIAISNHERRTESSVDRELTLGKIKAPQEVIVSIYRFVQEGLNNSYRHAFGNGQKVTASWTGGELVVSVYDSGPGAAAGQEMSSPSRPLQTGIGLPALRDRIELLGGAMTFERLKAGGTLLRAVFGPTSLEAVYD